MHNEELSLESEYGTLTWQIGGSLTGLIETEKFSLLPSLSLAYGSADLGEIDFTARAYGLTDDVSTDAGNVAMGVLRLTPELQIPLGSDDSAMAGITLGLSPSFICQQVIAEGTDTECGWGAGIQIMQSGARGMGQFSGRFDYEQVGGVNLFGSKIGYTVGF